MPVDRRRKQQQATSGRRRIDLLLLTMVIVLMAMGGILWASFTAKSGPAAPAAIDATGAVTIALPTVVRTPAAAGAPTLPAGSSDAPAAGVTKGKLAPEFVLKDLDGQAVSLSDFRGEVVLLNFWATWCGPCRIEIPDIRTVDTKYRDQGLAIVGVDIGETSSTVSKFVKQFDMGFTILLDSNMTVSQQYQTFSIPTSFFLDRRGVIREIKIGTMSQSYIEQVVSKLLSEP